MDLLTFYYWLHMLFGIMIGKILICSAIVSLSLIFVSLNPNLSGCAVGQSSIHHITPHHEYRLKYYNIDKPNNMIGCDDLISNSTIHPKILCYLDTEDIKPSKMSWIFEAQYTHKTIFQVHVAADLNDKDIIEIYNVTCQGLIDQIETCAANINKTYVPKIISCCNSKCEIPQYVFGYPVYGKGYGQLGIVIGFLTLIVAFAVGYADLRVEIHNKNN